MKFSSSSWRSGAEKSAAFYVHSPILFFFSYRCSETFHVGLAPPDVYDEARDQESREVARFSPHLVCRDAAASSPEKRQAEAKEGGGKQHQPSSSGSGTTYLSLTKACLCVVRSLSEERDWSVLSLILSKVPTVLQNKAIITRYGRAIYMFVTPLVRLTQKDSGYPEVLINTPPAGFSRADFHNRVFPVLAAMASYNEYLDSGVQRSLINALHIGLLSRDCNRVCVVALTACALEMKKSMYQVIPQVYRIFCRSIKKLVISPFYSS